MEYKEYFLKDICFFQEGYVNPKQTISDYFDGEIKWLRANDLQNSYVYNTSRTLTKLGFESAGKSAKLFKPNTIAISKSGTIGRLGILKDYMCGNRAVINIECNNEKLDIKYLYYFLLFNRSYIESLSQGSVQKNLYIFILEKVKIKLPDIATQKKIVKVLNDIDKKIELNNQINENLFEIIKQYIKENCYNNCNIEVNALSNIGRIQGGYAFKSKDLLDGSTKNKIFKIKNISSNGIDIENTQCIYDEIANKIDKKFLLTQGNVIIAMTGAELGKSGYVYGNEYRYFLNQRVGVIRGNDIFSELYLNCIFLQDDMQNLLNSKGYGSAQPNISTTDIENIEIPIPKESELKEFYEVCNPIYKKLILNSEQNQYLIKLRDILLPKLMNGEIDLDKIEI